MLRSDLNRIIREDLKRCKISKGSKFLLVLRSIVLDEGFRAVYTYRWRNYHAISGHRFRLKLWYGFNFLFNKHVIIDRNARIGPGFLLVHPFGVTIGGAQIGDLCSVYQGVTIGGNFRWDEEGNVPFPILGSNVKIMAGAVIVGPVRVGSNVIIGANSVVIKDVPDDLVVGGVPAKVIGDFDKDRYRDIG